jgi:hypothetical protein
MKTMPTRRDIRALLPDVKFQQIENGNLQVLSLRRFVADECLISVNNKTLANVHDSSVGRVQNIRCVAARQREAKVGRAGYAPA